MASGPCKPASSPKTPPALPFPSHCDSAKLAVVRKSANSGVNGAIPFCSNVAVKLLEGEPWTLSPEPKVRQKELELRADSFLGRNPVNLFAHEFFGEPDPL